MGGSLSAPSLFIKTEGNDVVNVPTKRRDDRDTLQFPFERVNAIPPPPSSPSSLEDGDAGTIVLDGNKRERRTERRDNAHLLHVQITFMPREKERELERARARARARERRRAKRILVNTRP